MRNFEIGIVKFLTQLNRFFSFFLMKDNWLRRLWLSWCKKVVLFMTMIGDHWSNHWNNVTKTSVRSKCANKLQKKKKIQSETQITEMITWCFTMTRKIPSLSEPRDSESDATSKISDMIILCSGVTVVGTCSRKAATC